MAGPQYIRLTAVRILQPKQKGPVVEMLHTVLKPSVTQLVPLPVMFNCSQQDGRTEQDRGNIVVVFQELFADVLQAIEDAAQAGRCIAIPMSADQLASAVSSALPKFPMPVKAGEMFDKGAFADKAVQQHEETKRDALNEQILRAREQRQAESVRTAEEDVDGAVKVVKAADEIAQRWDDFVQTDGESTGAPLVKVGDLRIHSVVEGSYFLEQAAVGDNGHGIQWLAPNVPQELMRTFPSEDEARQAVRLAGYGRRLVESK